MSAFCAPIQCTNPKAKLDVIAEEPASKLSGVWKVSCGDSKVQPEVGSSNQPKGNPEIKITKSSPKSSSKWAVKCSDPEKSDTIENAGASSVQSSVWKGKSLGVDVKSGDTPKPTSPIQSGIWKGKSLGEDVKSGDTSKPTSPIKSGIWKGKSLGEDVKSGDTSKPTSPMQSGIWKGKSLGEDVKSGDTSKPTSPIKSGIWKGSLDPIGKSETFADTAKKPSFKTVARPQTASNQEQLEIIESVPTSPKKIPERQDSREPPEMCITQLTEMSKALHSMILVMSSLGVGITNAYPPTPKPVKIWKKAVKTAEDTLLEEPESGKPKTMMQLTGVEKKFVKSQPFKLIQAPPQLTPRQKFIYKANQIAHQPFRMSRPPPPPSPSTSKERVKQKIVGLSKMAAHPMFAATLKNESKTHARFKSLANTIAKTTKMLRMMDFIKKEIAEEEEEEQEEENKSNEEEIKSGMYPLLKKEVLRHLFQYFSVADLKTARLVCEYWKRFSTPVLQRKSIVKLSGLCDICKSEWRPSDESIEPHDHSETISFYRFVLYIQDIPEDKRYFKPFRNFKVQNINVYFIRGLSTTPTRVFLMFLKLWGDKIHEFYLKSVQLCPPDSFYRVVDCCKRMNSLVLDDISVWLNPLNEASSLKFSMNVNYYVTSITFLTNWIGEERLHWQMILQAFPCLEELNLVDVAKSEINHCLSAILSLPQDEEEEEKVMELQKLGVFKQLSRQVMMSPFSFKTTTCLADIEKNRSFKNLALARVNMPFNMRKYNESQEEVNPDDSDVQGTKNQFKAISRQVGKQPFHMPKKSSEAIPVGKVNQGRLQNMSKKVAGQPFRPGRSNLVGPQLVEDPSTGKPFECSESPSDDGASSVETVKRSLFQPPKLDDAKQMPFQFLANLNATITVGVGTAEKQNDSSTTVENSHVRKGIFATVKKPTFQLPKADLPSTENNDHEQQQGDSPADTKSRAKKALLLKAKKTPFQLPVAELQSAEQQHPEQQGDSPADTKSRAKKALLLKAKKTPFQIPVAELQSAEQQHPEQQHQEESPQDFKKQARKAILKKAKMSPFMLPSGDSDATESAEESSPVDTKARVRRALLDQKKTPFSVPLAKLAEAKLRGERPKLSKFQAGVKRTSVNQPFTLISSSRPNSIPEVLPQKKVTFKSFAKPMTKFQLLKGQQKVRPFDRFKKIAKQISHQPFNLGDPIPHENVVPGSLLRKVSIATRETYEDHLKSSGKLKKSDAEENSSGSSGESCRDSSSSGDERNSIVELDLHQMNTHELLAELVERFDISHLSLRVNYTREDVASFPIILESCRDKVECLDLTRYPKVYMKEMELQFLTNPFETPEETVMLFPKVFRLSIAHNFVNDINEIRNSFPALKSLIINVILTEFQCKPCPYATYLKTNLMMSMKYGKPMPKVKTLVWNIQEARNHSSQKRTIVYKSNAIRHIPSIFPSLSKLTVSVTTAQDLHAIFRQCLQLHDLILLKNSFYRTKDEDVIGEYESAEEELARKDGILRPTRIKNGGVKQLRYLRRLSLENNNCCLTNRSIKHGFIHLRRLRSLHISRGQKISVEALKLLRNCRFLVHVGITKANINTPRSQEEKRESEAIYNVQEVQQTQMLDTNPTENPKVCRKLTLSPQKGLVRSPGGFQHGTKWNKIGARRYHFVTTTYQVNGRTYRLTRRHYDDQAENQQKHVSNESQGLDTYDDDEFYEEELRRGAIDPMKMILRAEKRLSRKIIEEESDFEKFVNDYDDDYETDEEGYNDKDDELLQYGKRMLDEDESSDEDGICPEDDSMYEGDKEFYLDTEVKSSDGDESYCDTLTEYEYQADKETSAEETKPERKGVDKPEGQADLQVEAKSEGPEEHLKEVKSEGLEEHHKEVKSDGPEERHNEAKSEGPEERHNEYKPEDQAELQGSQLVNEEQMDAGHLSPAAILNSVKSSQTPASGLASPLTIKGSEFTVILNELTKELSLHKEKRRKKLERKKTVQKHETLQKTQPVQITPVSLETPQVMPEITTFKDKILSWQATETACVEYEESIRRMSITSIESRHSSGTVRALRQDDSFDEFCESMISVPVHNLSGVRPRRNIPESQAKKKTEVYKDYGENRDTKKKKKQLPERKTKKLKKHKSKHKQEGSSDQPTTSSRKTSKKRSSSRKEASNDLRQFLIDRMISEVRKDLRK